MSTYYAVHRESKVHRKIDGPLDYLFGEEVRKVDNEGWIKWVGGECPLPDDQMVEVRFRNGECAKDSTSFWDWEQSGVYSIIAYRPVLEQEKTEPKKSWHERGELPPVGTVCEYSLDELAWHECHIRYVLDNDPAPDSDGWKAVAWCPHLEKEQIATHYWKFRPLKTDRERTIEAAKKYLRDNGGFYADEVVKLLYDAKMLHLPEDE